MILALCDEAVQQGARRHQAAAMLGLTGRTLERWRNAPAADDARRGPRQAPANKLSPDEEQAIVAVVTSPAYRDQSPKQIVPQLADRGIYVAAEATFYRVMRRHGLSGRRGRARPSTKRPREHLATAPWQVACWDITYLRTQQRGSYFYLYLIIDVWSRMILAAVVHASESAEHAAALAEHVREQRGSSLQGWVLHADNGNAMKGATMLATLQRLGVVPSFSRPRVSDDNPYIEALFKTLKYCPQYPSGGFATLAAAQAWVDAFVEWYNTEHLHSAIGYVTPADRHAGNDLTILANRRAVYHAAHRAHPQRWARHPRPWGRPDVVRLNPELQNQLSTAA
jgi:transposase InsO family protein